MFWLSISNLAPELKGISPNTRPWAIIKSFWEFCNSYGEYQALPPSQRRRFIIEREAGQEAKVCSESCW